MGVCGGTVFGGKWGINENGVLGGCGGVLTAAHSIGHLLFNLALIDTSGSANQRKIEVSALKLHA